MNSDCLIVKCQEGEISTPFKVTSFHYNLCATGNQSMCMKWESSKGELTYSLIFNEVKVIDQVLLSMLGVASQDPEFAGVEAWR